MATIFARCVRVVRIRLTPGLLGLSMLAACSSGNSPSSAPRTGLCAQIPSATCITADGHRFTVAIGQQAIRSATAAGVSLPEVVTAALNHIGALLPGSTTQIGIILGTQVIPEIGVTGFTDPSSGEITITLDPHSQIPYKQTLLEWVPDTLSHEIDHAVRIEGGPGFGNTLEEALISEGLATAFDEEAWPNLHDPWADAVMVPQEAALWQRAQSDLALSGRQVYDEWFFGIGGIPRWTGFTIGYHIVRDYLSRHPNMTAASLIDEPATATVAGSGYHG
jgi:Predicted Zn-dependent protease (DUF2268)